jgi:hypothetical protein
MRPSRAPGLLLLLSLAVCLACVAYPIYVIRPFRAQGPRELLVALSIIRWRPIVTAACAAVAVLAAILIWRRRTGWKRRWAAVVAALAVCALTLLARVNVYEIMFHPNERPSFKAAQSAKFDADEKVIAIRLGDQARAYPVRSISYHHVINDEVDKRAIVATY